MIKISGDEGKSAALIVESEADPDQVRVCFRFRLPWVSGQVHGVCGRERFEELKRAIDELAQLRRASLEFINEDGNIELSITRRLTGTVELTAHAMPEMVSGDRVAVSLEGVLSLA